MADWKLGAVPEVGACGLSEPEQAHECGQPRDASVLDGNEALVAGRIGEVAPEHALDEMGVVELEALHAREMVQCCDSHHLRGGQTASRPSLGLGINQTDLHFLHKIVHIVE